MLAGIPALADSFSYTGSAQTFSAPITGIYDIVAYGASGGNGDRTFGGLGAEIGADFNLTAGETLTVDVGQQGDNGVSGVGGGGGGSFVVAPGSVPLLIAGAGGGGGLLGTNGGNALTGTAGGGGNFGGVGGTNGQGGSGGGLAGGGGGAGFYGNGANGGREGGGRGTDYPALSGGSGFISGNGGFGGGGGGGDVGGAGGGGYSGGGGGGFDSTNSHGGGGGGGGSYLDASAFNTLLLADIQSGDGLVTITEVPASTPEPGSYALLGLGLLGLAGIHRLRANR